MHSQHNSNQVRRPKLHGFLKSTHFGDVSPGVCHALFPLCHLSEHCPVWMFRRNKLKAREGKDCKSLRTDTQVSRWHPSTPSFF